MTAKYLARSLAIEKVVECPAGHEQLLADLDDLDELGRVAIEVDHVAGLLGGLGAGVHGHADVGLGQGRGVVGAVAHHGDELAAGLFLADVGELGLGRRLGDEVVDAGLVGDRFGRQRIVAGDHDDPQPHLAEPGEPFADALLEDVLELDQSDDLIAGRHGQRGCALRGDRIDRLLVAVGYSAPGSLDWPGRRCSAPPCGFSMPSGRSTPLIRVWAENSTNRLPVGASTSMRRTWRASSTMLLPSGVRVGQRRHHGQPRQLALRRPAHGHEQSRAAIAQRDRAGLVQEQRIDVAGDLDGLAALGDQVGGQGPVHPGDPDRRQERTNGRRDQADQERDQGRDVQRDVEVARHRIKRGRHDQEDDRERGKDDRQRDLVGGLLPRSALDQGDHPVQEAFADARRDLDDDPVGKDPRSAGHPRPVAAGLADHRRTLAR